MKPLATALVGLAGELIERVLEVVRGARLGKRPALASAAHGGEPAGRALRLPRRVLARGQPPRSRVRTASTRVGADAPPKTSRSAEPAPARTTSGAERAVRSAQPPPPPDREPARESDPLLVRAEIAAAAVLVVGALFAVGWEVGRRSAWRPLSQHVTGMQRMETLGGVARAHDEWLEQRRREEGRDLPQDERYTWQVAQAYDDPARALGELDRYTWQVAAVPVPFVGVAPAPGDHPGVHVNSQHFRHPAPLAIPKPEGVFRVFVTGGSTAFGSGAPSDAETITGFLQELVDREVAPVTGRRYEIVNAANPAWASTHERILVTNRLSELEPDLVVSFSGNNDAHFGFLGLHSLWFRTYGEHYHATLLSETLERLGDGPLPFARTWSPKTEEPVPPAEVTRRLAKNLRLASTALAETGAPYVFVLQPTLAVTKKALSERELHHRETEVLGEGSARYFRECYASYREHLPTLDLPGFRFVDGSGVFDAREAEEELFLDSYHFGDRGNRLLARYLLEVLRAEL